MKKIWQQHNKVMRYLKKEICILLKDLITLTNIFENSVLDQLEFNNGNNY
jgi:hypothetical protein